MVLRRWVVWLFLLLAVSLSGAARPTVAGPSRRAGSIRGRVRPAGALAGGQLVFFLDGAIVQPRFQKGSFTVKNVLPGRHVLSVVDPGRNVAARRQVTVRAQGTSEAGTLDLIAGGRITGIVSQLDPDTGDLTPLPNVQVVAQPAAVPLGLELPSLPPPPGGWVPISGFTDDTGTYDLPGVAPGFYVVTVEVPGLQAGVAQVLVSTGTTATADFQLAPVVQPGIGTVAGTVTDRGGNAIAGAMVTINSGSFVQPTGFVVAVGSIGGGTILPPLWSRFSTLTDQNGRYSLNVPAGAAQLDVSADGFEPFSTGINVPLNDSLPANVTLDADGVVSTGTIVGTVVDARTKQPIAGADVHVLLPPGVAIAVRNFFATTDENGHYELDTIAARSWTIATFADGYQGSSQKVTVPANASVELDFSLEADPVVDPRR